MKNKCFIDFDGTIVSNKKRLYRFFQDCLPINYKDALSEDEFWSLKRLKINEFIWMNETFGLSLDIESCIKRKKNEVENEYYLGFDELFEYSKTSLMNLKNKYILYLISRRSKEKSLKEELIRLGIMDFFEDVLVIAHNDKSKSSVIKGYCDVLENDIVVGDTEDDIECGRDLNILTYFVLSGIRDRWILKKYLNKKILCVNSIKDI